MKIILLLLFTSLSFSQVQLSDGNLQTIDFTGYSGSGFTPTPGAGQLDSDDWAASGMSDAPSSFVFGGSATTGDFARGESDGSGETTGGFYALNDGGNIRFMVQPGGSDWTPGDLTLRIQNVTGSTLSKLNVEYQVFVNNDRPRANSIIFSYSDDDASYTDLIGLNYVSPEASDANGWVLAVTRTTSITGLNIADDDFVYIRWTGDDVSGSGSRDEFAIDNILLSPQDVPLPVELSSFSAIVMANGIKLNWRTETEVSNYGFEVERAAPLNPPQGGKFGDWISLGFVEGHGNSNSPKEYSFIDNIVTGGKYSYRLKQIDNDGKFEYSKVIEIDLGAPLEYELSQNYPNPFNPSTTIKFSIPEKGNIKLMVYNILGEEIVTLIDEVKDAGVHTINYNAAELNSGIYFYILNVNNFVAVKKMQLVK